MYAKAADGTGQAEPLTMSERNQAPMSWSADGQSLVLMELGRMGGDLTLFSLDAERPAEALLATDVAEVFAAVSPDGRWMAYVSDEAGQFEVYVRPFLNVADRSSVRSRSHWSGRGDSMPTAGTTAVWRCLKHQWLFLHSLDSVAAIRRLVEFYVDEHNRVLPHSAFRGQTPDEMYFGTGDAVPADLTSRAAAARRARGEANRSATCATCPAVEAAA